MSTTTSSINLEKEKHLLSSWARSPISFGLAAFAGTWGAGALITRGANRNGALPWAKLSKLPHRQANWQLTAFWTLLYGVPTGLFAASSYYPDMEYRENAPRRFANATAVAGTGFIMLQTFRAQQAIRRAAVPKLPFWRGRFHTMAAGAYVAFFAAASVVSFTMVFHQPVPVKKEWAAGSGEKEEVVEFQTAKSVFGLV